MQAAREHTQRQVNAGRRLRVSGVSALLLLYIAASVGHFTWRFQVAVGSAEALLEQLSQESTSSSNGTRDEKGELSSLNFVRVSIQRSADGHEVFFKPLSSDAGEHGVRKGEQEGAAVDGVHSKLSVSSSTEGASAETVADVGSVEKATRNIFGRAFNAVSNFLQFGNFSKSFGMEEPSDVEQVPLESSIGSVEAHNSDGQENAEGETVLLTRDIIIMILLSSRTSAISLCNFAVAAFIGMAW